MPKKKQKKIFKKLGITMSDAFNMFLHQVLLHKGIPFELKVPDDELAHTISEARKGIIVVDELKRL